MDVTDVKLRNSFQICHVLTNNLFVKKCGLCIVETEHGIDIGKVCKCHVNARELEGEVKGRLLRVPTAEDLEALPELESIEKKAFDICKARAKEKNLEMKLISVKCLFDKTKIIFYFVAENRIDFRELVRDLAGIFRTRIEMRQIGVRDEARLVGGFGPCGRALCCTHMKEGFDPVSIKMAKEQNLNLNSMKISGMCGRLLCCLSHEYELYREINRGLPPLGVEIRIAQKVYTVEAVDAIQEKIKLRCDNYVVDVSARDMRNEGGKYLLSDAVMEKIANVGEEDSDEDHSASTPRRQTRVR